MHLLQLSVLVVLAGCVWSIEIPHYQEELLEHHHKKPIVPIIKQSFDQHHEGYQYSYETGNGIHAHETGYIKNKGDKKHETLVQQGTITYHDEHGHPITLHYIADEHGFQPQGDHLPTPVPLPEANQKAIAEAHEAAGAHEEQHSYQHLPEGYEQEEY